MLATHSGPGSLTGTAVGYFTIPQCPLQTRVFPLCIQDPGLAHSLLGHPGHYRLFGSLSDLCPPEASSSPAAVTTTTSADTAQCPRKGNVAPSWKPVLLDVTKRASLLGGPPGGGQQGEPWFAGVLSGGDMASLPAHGRKVEHGAPMHGAPSGVCREAGGEPRAVTGGGPES